MGKAKTQTPENAPNVFDIAVIGGGLSGLCAALAMDHALNAMSGGARRIALIDAASLEGRPPDGRATTLIPGAKMMLARIGANFPPAETLTGMEVGEGDAASPFAFELERRQDGPLAFVVENDALHAALLSAVQANANITAITPAKVAALDVDGAATLTLEDGRTLKAALCLAADGRASALRRLSGISQSVREFGQSALVTTVTHQRPHEGIALQRFAPIGAIAALPLPDIVDADGRTHHRSQIVWSDRPGALAAAQALPEDALCALIEEQLWSRLGINELARPVRVYPLKAARSDALTAARVALIGDAARIIHPLAGQGFNLAVRDIAVLAETVGEAAANGQDIGVAGLLGYERRRRLDETSLGTLTGFLADEGPAGLFGHIRRLGFALTDALPDLQPLIIREARGELGPQPALLAG